MLFEPPATPDEPLTNAIQPSYSVQVSKEVPINTDRHQGSSGYSDENLQGRDDTSERDQLTARQAAKGDAKEIADPPINVSAQVTAPEAHKLQSTDSSGGNPGITEAGSDASDEEEGAEEPVTDADAAEKGADENSKEDPDANGPIAARFQAAIASADGPNPHSPDHPCSTANRRALARKGDAASEEEWKNMTTCHIHLSKRKTGQFFLHVSKSGGTSVLGLLEKFKCFADATTEKNDLSYYMKIAKLKLGLYVDTNWVKSSRFQKYGLHFAQFAHIKRKRVQGVSCGQMQSSMFEYRRVAMMSEAVIPFQSHENGLCDDMVNSMLFREPLRRIESHYRQLNIDCKNRQFCEQHLFVNGTNFQKYDSKKLSDVFDVVSDNYYTRSLVGNGYFEWDSNEQIASLNQHPDVWTKIFPIANASLHKFDWMMLLDSGDPEEAESRDLIFQYGLGLGENARLEHRRKDDKKTKESMLSDEEWLRERNSLDYMLWETAIELNRLDVISTQRMMPYYMRALEVLKAAKAGGAREKCCGITCSTFGDSLPALQPRQPRKRRKKNQTG